MSHEKDQCNANTASVGVAQSTAPSSVPSFVERLRNRLEMHRAMVQKFETALAVAESNPIAAAAMEAITSEYV